MDNLSRRTLLRGSLAGAASLMLPRLARAADLAPVEREIQKRHGEAVQRLQDWIHQPTIAAEGGAAGRQAGFRQGGGWPRRGEPEGARGDLPRGAPRAARGGTQAAGQPRAGRGRRGGDRVGALRGGGSQGGDRGGAVQDRR